MPSSNQVILPALKGLVFLPAESALRPAGLAPGSAGPSGIAAPGLALLAKPGFSRTLVPFIGRPLTFADLQAITRLTGDWYRKHGRPFVSVTVPPQNVSSGIVQVVVTEYRVGTVTVSGNRWFSSALLRNESGLAPGQTLTLPGVQSDLDWLNANPFRSVNAMFEPGAAPGTTNVVLATKDRLPVHLYAAYDNAGVPSLGLGEWSIGGTWGNVAGLDQLLSYQFTRSISGAYSAHALSWSIPLPWRDRLLVFGSYATENPDIGSDFTEPGRSGQASLRYVHTLPRLALPGGLGLTEDVQLGYDFKTTNNDLEFGGVSVFTGQAEIDQFPLIYDATLTDPYGQTVFQNQLVLSPGGMTGANNDEAFQTLVPGSAANYVYDRAGLTRVTFLPAGFSWIGRALGQVSNRNLLYSEQLGAGGPDSVRGYYTDTALGSQGVLLSNEIRGPAFSFSRLLDLSTPVRDQEQAGIFWDYALVSQVEPIPDEVNKANLSSVGVALHATLGRYADLNFDLGWQLVPAPGTDKRGVFGDVAVVVGY
ncbi:MAG TPA: ShlB/FhaC/HecB family hemolysin secretion/activation protein [Acetobacteraceae bacterium]|nr:ShlB/FhaC/HecB family hemolysin secretion/activation protein [Acetobacteraceae bacterium]